MPNFACRKCGQSVHVGAVDVALPVTTENVACTHCGTQNMLSLSTVLMALLPSIVLGLAAAFANDAWMQLSPGYLVLMTGYWVGVLLGFGIATAFGRLSAPRVRSV